MSTPIDVFSSSLQAPCPQQVLRKPKWSKAKKKAIPYSPGGH